MRTVLISEMTLKNKIIFYDKRWNDIINTNVKKKQTVFVRPWQMPQIMAIYKDDQGHKVKSFDTSRNTLSQEMIMWNMKALQ